MRKPLHYFYDKDADVFYFSSGVPKNTDTTIEAGNDVLLRIDPKTKRVRGFTLLNSSKRAPTVRRGYTFPFSLAPMVH